MSEASEEVDVGPVDGSVDAAGGRQPVPVVTLFESYGSGAAYRRPRVAAALGVPFHEQAFSSEQLEESARAAGEGGAADAVVRRDGQRLVRRGGRRRRLQRPAGPLRPRRAEHRPGRRSGPRGGGVIVGRNGAFILADWPGRAARDARRAAAAADRPRRAGGGHQPASGRRSARRTKTGSAPICRSNSTTGTRATPPATTSSSTPGEWTWTPAWRSSSTRAGSRPAAASAGEPTSLRRRSAA